MYYKNLLATIHVYLLNCSSNPSHTLTEHSIVNILRETKGMSLYEAEEAFFNMYTMGYISAVVNSNGIPEYIVL